MAEIKDKLVTVESLSTVNIHNQNTYMTKVDPTGSGTLTMTGDGSFTGDITSNTVTLGNAILSYDQSEGALKISFQTE